MKICFSCGVNKPHSEFHKAKQYHDGLTYQCKTCRSKQHREYRIQKRYGISMKEYQDLLDSAGFKCEVCSKEVKPTGEHEGKKDRACVDHNHKTGKVRGILCADCNWAIGLLQDNPELCLSAAKYLNGRK